MNFSENRAICDIMSNNVVEQESPKMTIQLGACVACRISNATCACKRTYAHTPAQSNMQYLLLFHIKNGFKHASQCYITCTLPMLLA